MKIGVWHTSHEISYYVCKAIVKGLPNAELIHASQQELVKDYDLHIAYGILRGTAEVFHKAGSLGLPYINVDRGYWKPGHYDGYYRISLNGTQQTTGLAKLEPDYERWNALGLPILTRPLHDPNGSVLFCPPTEPVSQFFNVQPQEVVPDPKLIIRRKDAQTNLQKDLNKCSMVYTFNSSVGWEALRQGIPIISDPAHSFVGAYQKQVDALRDMSIKSRYRMFSVMAGLQLRLEEIKSGLLWPLIQKLLTVDSKKEPLSGN
jgi:hypothetical protein